ncbi:class I SAM-dependent methyltransferase [Sphingomonas arantia]|uniref:Class I SAM-dependent methyltransferase n=1 Tax=Sphingomonas arantia TaxID=1460676 RepID=A0ABW4TZ38_9SPHN
MESSAVLPPEFDAGHYRGRYEDLRALDDAQAASHFAVIGHKEGREGSPLSFRETFLAEIVQRDEGDILEIGPYYSPVVTGPNVAYLDVLDADELRARAIEQGHDLAKAPAKIDFVGDISTVDRSFAAVVSCHAIEHQPDLVRHLNTVAKILEPGGRYYLMVPDHRYCFDALIPGSTIAGVLQAHREGRTRHTLQNVIEHRALTTHNNPALHWQGLSGESKPANQETRILAAIAEYDRADGGYVDVHAWYFTPTSFRNITDALFQMGLSELKPVRIFNTPMGRFEFCAILEKPREEPASTPM